MQIAVIGWGSLVWCPGVLQIKTRWRLDGPELPVEFARISKDCRLTLVLLENTLPQKTYWAVSAYTNVKKARENLLEREGSKDIQKIAFLDHEGNCGGSILPEARSQIKNWLTGHRDIHTAIWTALDSNWQKRYSKSFNYDDALAYIKEHLGNERGDKIKEYICNTPPQIQTPLRKRIEQDLDWKPNLLSTSLFE